jgi:hypothetical protein
MCFVEFSSIAREIELKLSRLGRIWVAEYVHAGVFDENLNRDLFDTLGGKKPLTTGQWIALARRIQQAFLAEHRDTVVEGLKGQDFGVLGNRSHPVSRLMDFRNTFSHGGLNASEEDTRTHRILLSELIERIPGLIKQPILFRKEGRTLDADTGALRPSTVDGTAMPDLHPFIVGCDGKTVLDLYPLFVVEQDRLAVPDPKKRTHPITALFEREVLRSFVERYQWEKNGHFDSGKRIREKATRPAPSIVTGEVDAALAAGHRLVLVEAHPGCCKSSVLMHLCDSTIASRYAGACLWLIEPQDIGQSGTAFANFLLRRVESCLGLADGSLGSAEARWRVVLDRAKQALEQSGKRLLVGIEDLHAGWESIRSESVSVVDVYRSLAGGPITVVATAHPGRMPGRVPFDWILPADRFPVPAEAEMALNRLEVAVGELCLTNRPVRKRVLKQLVAQTQPATLFALCDALDTDGCTVFEPEVERALWDLRPLLRVRGGGDARTWEPFTPALARCLSIGGVR